MDIYYRICLVFALCVCGAICRPTTSSDDLNGPNKRSPDVNEQSAFASGSFVEEAKKADLDEFSSSANNLIFLEEDREMRMTSLTKGKVQQLKNEVNRYWKGEYDLVLIHAFVSQSEDTNDIFALYSLHREGRAIDVTLGKKENDGTITTIQDDPEIENKLKKLASLALASRFSFVKLHEHHLHASSSRY